MCKENKKHMKIALSIVFLIVMYNSMLGFVLFTTLYNEKNIERVCEYITCMEINKRNKLIEKIYVFYDTSQDSPTDNIIFTYLLNSGVRMAKIEGRARYGDFINFANEKCSDHIIIIANADMYFDDTLSALVDYNLENKFLAITRWNILSDNTASLEKCPGSQDVWIFKSPIKRFKDGIFMGIGGCDSTLAREAMNAGLEVINPCLTIKTFHLHLSKIRHQENFRYSKRIGVQIPFSTLH